VTCGSGCEADAAGLGDRFLEPLSGGRAAGARPGLHGLPLLHRLGPRRAQPRRPRRRGHRAYAERMVDALGDLVRVWITFNEPTLLVYRYTKPWWQRDYSMPPGLPEGASAEAPGGRRRGADPEPLHRACPGQGADRAAAARRHGWRRHVRRLAERPRVGRGPADVVLAQMTATPGRARQVDFPQPYLVVCPALLVRADAGVESAADLAGLSVAVARRSVHRQRLPRLVPGAGGAGRP
jgi:Bacterial extracellular solute-binding proteins, family 3